MTRQLETLGDRVFARAALAPRRATFGLGGCRFHVASEWAKPIEAARELFLWEQPADPSPSDYEIAVVVDPTILDDLSAVVSATAPNADLETFAGEVFLARYDAPTTRVFVESGPRSMRGYAVVQRGARLAVVSATDEARYAVYVVRCMREIYLRETENRGGGVLHAACYVRNATATLIVGGKGAGKTSFVLAMSAKPGCEFLSNDRVMLTSRGDQVIATTFPMACRVGLGTIESSERLKAVFAARAQLVRPQDAAVLSASATARQFASTAKLELTQRELIDKVGFTHAQSAPVGRIVFPELGGARSPIGVLVSPDEALRRLQEQAMTPREEKWITPWLVERKHSDEVLARRMSALFRALVEAVPAVHVRCGFESFGPTQLDEHLVAAMELG
jgi:hypothetical protein